MKHLAPALLLWLSCTMLFAQPGQKTIIYFPFGKYYLTNQAATILDTLAKQQGELQIDSVQIMAFCDVVGNYAANDTLARQRATTVKNYLQNHQFNSNNFKAVTGYGKRRPVNNNATDSLRALNRRAEIIVYYKTPSAEKPASVGSKNNPKTKGMADSLRAIMLNTRAGDKFALSNLDFYGNRHLLLPASLPLLDTLFVILQQFKSIEIEVQGYVCCIAEGNEGYDMDTQSWNLSVNRAKTVYNYLIAKGIAANRLIYKGYGSKPLVKEFTERERTINRRVEIKVTKR
jgi:outer membrane protein OmpA-like peptidoglycan-associated protein